jgi:hypothetical protein
MCAMHRHKPPRLFIRQLPYAIVARAYALVNREQEKARANGGHTGIGTVQI